jgi:hypothetical protein
VIVIALYTGTWHGLNRSGRCHIILGAGCGQGFERRYRFVHALFNDVASCQNYIASAMDRRMRVTGETELIG